MGFSGLSLRKKQPQAKICTRLAAAPWALKPAINNIGTAGLVDGHERFDHAGPQLADRDGHVVQTLLLQGLGLQLQLSFFGISSYIKRRSMEDTDVLLEYHLSVNVGGNAPESSRAPTRPIATSFLFT